MHLAALAAMFLQLCEISLTFKTKMLEKWAVDLVCLDPAYNSMLEQLWS